MTPRLLCFGPPFVLLSYRSRSELDGLSNKTKGYCWALTGTPVLDLVAVSPGAPPMIVATEPRQVGMPLVPT